ncbi:MAG: PepSY domain-containing protein [Syntrophomonadaceae bacterium]|nr:PepSY domain-containing protein [Syntrophomonadaceae bacterium]
MSYITKSFLSLVLTIMFLFSMVIVPVQAATPISLEQAIQTAKTYFPVTESFSDFSSEYSSSPFQSVWNLNWSSKDAGQGSLHVAIDTNTGNVQDMNYWTNKPVDKSSRNISAEQALAIGGKWLSTLAADKIKNLQLVTGQNPIPLSNNGYDTLTLRWQRYENGIPVIGDGVTMHINLSSRELTSYNLQWVETTFPAADKAISTEQALKVFRDENMLARQYFLSHYRVFSNPQSSQPVQLVYLPDHPSGAVIDAISGKPLILKPGQWKSMYDKEMNYLSGGMGSADQSAATVSKLSPEEIAELEKSKNILSQEQAMEKVRRWVSIPAAAVLTNASLSRYYNDPDTRVWSFNWEIPQGENPAQVLSVWATVDCQTGQIYSFHQSINQSGNGVLTETEAEQLAREFIKQIEPLLADQLVLEKQNQNNIPYQTKAAELPAEWDFSFTRLVDGIKFPHNGVNIAVSGINKQVISYYLNWSKHEFPPASESLSSDSANAIYLKHTPMSLSYNVINSENASREIKLVYQLLPGNDKAGMAMIDARNGEPLDHMGKPLSSRVIPRAFSDINGHFAAEEINLVGRAGLMSEYGNLFKPDEKINTLTFLRAMLGARDGANNYADSNDEQIIKICQERGWLKDKVPASVFLTRELLTCLVVRSQGLELPTRYPQIFTNPYPQDKSINDSNLGFVAMANGFGWLYLQDAFNANDEVTRGEAAYTLVKSLHN